MRRGSKYPGALATSMPRQGPDWGRTFPILKAKTYLANHSLGAVPAATEQALREYWHEWATQGVTAWEGPWWKSVVDFGKSIESLLGAEKGSVAPFPNVTRAMAGVASALDYSGPRRRIVMTDLEFTTFYPFWRGQEREGAEIVIVESEDGVNVPVQDIERAIDERTLLVATCHVYFRSGAVQDLASLSEAAHRRGALILGDGYQAVGTLPVDVRELGVDFYVGGSHKFLCGGPGASFLYVRPELVEGLQPRMTGWFGLADPFGFVKDLAASDPHAGVMKFLDGTPNVPGLYASREGIRLVREQGARSIRRRSLERTDRIIARADELGLDVRTPRDPDERGGMVCIDFPNSQQTTSALVKDGTVVDWRPKCGLRVSPHFYNADRDVDVFLTGLEKRAKPMKTSRRREAPVSPRLA